MQEVEAQGIDRRFEGLRLRDDKQQHVLMDSILERGICEPLQGITKGEDDLILLDGFKRLRCAFKLKITAVPWASLAGEERGGILQLLRQSNVRSLTILEQAALLDRLKKEHGMSLIDMARFLERSPAWVGLRLGTLDEMSATVKEALFSGRFPVRSYMYGLRPFTRVKKGKRAEVDDFVRCVSGKGLSGRMIETLAHGYFQGGETLRQQIREGNLDWTLQQLRRCDNGPEEGSLNDLERRMLKDLELSQKYMDRVSVGLFDARLKAEAFFRTAHVLVERVMGKMTAFQKTLEVFYARREQTKRDSDAVCRGKGEKSDCPAAQDIAKDGSQGPLR